VQLDVTNTQSIAAAADRLTDVQVVINNAGAIIGGSLLDGASIDAVRSQVETNVIGPLAMSPRPSRRSSSATAAARWSTSCRC
jgi:NADP-dependent 3-hydroxy acid dehydrogenase YdfG